MFASYGLQQVLLDDDHIPDLTRTDEEVFEEPMKSFPFVLGESSFYVPTLGFLFASKQTYAEASHLSAMNQGSRRAGTDRHLAQTYVAYTLIDPLYLSPSVGQFDASKLANIHTGAN
jgi:hypothetical protein